ncbi:MAG: glycerophosphoryl diester phosphodiesterase membrane domain-containing protein, partial [Deltaproteobacteria bacterium]|nr:glycerophosphoryl diester phosphodiesterase membrane domain-containing protein [Deltaproteobacteria bacterium]
MLRSFLGHFSFAGRNLGRAVRPVVAFEFWFCLIYAVVLTPALAWLLNSLVASSGRMAIGNYELLSFFLSIRGIFFLLISASFFIGFGFAEQAGLLIASDAAIRGRRIAVSSVLWANLTQLPALIRLGLLQAAGYAAACLPFAATGFLAYTLLLGDQDINYYLTARPWQWWTFLALAGALTVLYLSIAAWLFVRWLFAIPALMLENMGSVKALRESRRRMRGHYWQYGTPLAVWWVCVLTGSAGTAWLIMALAGQVIGRMGLNMTTLLPIVVGFLVIGVLVEIGWFVAGKAVHSLIIIGFYRETGPKKERLSGEIRLPGLLSPTALKALGRLGVAVGLAGAAFSAVVFIEGFRFEPRIAITAHRGSSLKAPENTMSSLHQAVSDGADYAEIDVQATADGVVVLMHDADLMRLAGVNRKLEDIRYEELKDIDIGSWFSREFNGERTATLQEAMAFAGGRIKLNIELKYNRADPELAGRVGRLIERNGFFSECVVSSLDQHELRRLKEACPDVKTGLIVFRAVGNVSRSEFDFISINAGRISPGMVRDARENGRQIHVWTVNDMQTALSMFEMGVDNIITDRPAFLKDLYMHWKAMS